MACPTYISLSSPVKAMVIGFETGSGICVDQFGLWINGTLMVLIVIFTAWVCYGYFMQWTEDKKKENVGMGISALAFMTFFLSVLILY